MRLFLPSSHRSISAIAALALVATIPAFADDTSAYQDPAGQGTQSWGGNLALTFQVNSPITVDDLGAYDSTGTGIITSPITVGIFNSAGTLLTFAVFDGTYLPTNYGYDVFQPVTPVVLGPGPYEVDAFGFGATYHNGNLNTGSSAGPVLVGGTEITFLGAAWDSNFGALDDPKTCDSCVTGPTQASQFDAGSFYFLQQLPQRLSPRR